MPEQHLFEYATIRVVPHVEREEFVNTGVILYCGKVKFLDVIVELNEKRVRALCEETDLEELESHIRSFKKICAGGADAGPIGKLPIAERFRWLTATRSTVLQTSKVHPGFCDDPREMLENLYRQMVM